MSTKRKEKVWGGGKENSFIQKNVEGMIELESHYFATSE